MSWRIQLCDLNGRGIAELTNLAHGRRVAVRRSKPKGLTFQVPSDHENVATTYNDGQPHVSKLARIIKASRLERQPDGTNVYVPRITAPIFDVIDEGQGAEQPLTTVVCFDPLMYLDRRRALDSLGSADLVEFTTTHGIDILKTLIDRTNAVSPTGISTNLAHGAIFENVENLVTNPNFETDTSGWTAVAPNKISRVTEQSKFTGASLKCERWGIGDSTIASNAITVTAAGDYSAAMWVYVPNTWKGARIAITLEGWAGATGIMSKQADLSIREQWQLVTVGPITIGSGDLSGTLAARGTFGEPDGQHFYIDGAVFNAGTSPIQFSPFSPKRTVRWERRYVGNAMADLTDVAGGFDVELIALDRTDGIYGALQCRMSLGQLRRHMRLGWDIFPYNLAGVRRTDQGTRLVNSLLGQGGGNALGDAIFSSQSDPTSINRHRLFEADVSMSSINDQTHLDAEVFNVLSALKNGFEHYEMVPALNCPPPWNDLDGNATWAIGDVVPVAASSRLRGGFEVPMRIDGFDLEITDEGEENVSEIVAQIYASVAENAEE